MYIPQPHIRTVCGVDRGRKQLLGSEAKRNTEFPNFLVYQIFTAFNNIDLTMFYSESVCPKSKKYLQTFRQKTLIVSEVIKSCMTLCHNAMTSRDLTVFKFFTLCTCIK